MPMMNYDDHGRELNMSDHILHERKLRPLMPRPTICSSLQPPHCSSIQNTSFCAWNYHLITPSVHYQNKREFNAEPLVSQRWNPTKEQIQALEEMYKRGLRTPTAEQIQQITQKLRQFGKIQGKNVFYWFQNHKARERQKWRRQLGFLPGKLGDVEALHKKKSELGKKEVEEEQKTNWAILSNCRTKSEMAESRRTSGWAQFEGRELQETISRKKRAKKATSHQVLSSYNQPHNNNNYLLNAISTTTTLKAYSSFCVHVDDDDLEMENENSKTQILQLFPVRDNNEISSRKEKENEMFTTSMNTSLGTPMQFFEFLPLKT